MVIKVSLSVTCPHLRFFLSSRPEPDPGRGKLWACSSWGLVCRVTTPTIARLNVCCVCTLRFIFSFVCNFTDLWHLARVGLPPKCSLVDSDLLP